MDVPSFASREFPPKYVPLGDVFVVILWQCSESPPATSDQSSRPKEREKGQENSPSPLAVIYWREHTNLAVASLPHSMFSQYEWVELLSLHWSQSDRESFPPFGDWTKSPEWMLSEETTLLERINTLQQQKLSTSEEIDQQIHRLSQDFTHAALAANQGPRRLLTAQNDELVEEVKSVFAEIGFTVEVVDELLDASLPKREYLRLRLPNDISWEAIEVRGYGKSAGKTSDLYRLGRFANLFQQEKGRPPDKQIYVVNGQLDIRNPSHRQEPLASAEEDIEVFSKNNGVVISTTDLFRVLQTLDKLDVAGVRDSIINTVGRSAIPVL